MLPHARVVAVLLALCLVCAPAPQDASAQGRAAKNRISVHAKGHRAVVVNERGRPHRLDLSKHIGAAHIEDVSVVFLTRKGGFVYLVLDVCGLSKLPPDARQCGAGDECNLVWLKLDGGWRVREAKSVLYESCWYSTTNDSAVRVEGRRLFIAYDNFHDETHGEATYDADSPEKGLVVLEKPLSKGAP
jgi:hypothetical protein